MKLALVTLMLLVAVACSRKANPAPAPPSVKEQKRSMDRRVRALDNVLAKGETPESPEQIASNLTAQALREFSSRIPNATNIESNVRFSSPGVAVVSVNYTLPESQAPRTQIIEFAAMNEQWTMSWKPDRADDYKPNKLAIPAP